MQGLEAEEARVGAIASPSRPSDHLLTVAQDLCLTALLVGVVGLAGRWLAWPLLTSTVGPTACLFAAHPKTEPARLRNAAMGHAVAVGLGLGTFVLFGLEPHPSVSRAGMPSWRQVLASAAFVGVTMSVLELLHSHHAPAAATALLITTGMAKPGAPLYRAGGGVSSRGGPWARSVPDGRCPHEIVVRPPPIGPRELPPVRR